MAGAEIGADHRPLLELCGIRKVFRTSGLLGRGRSVIAVEDVSFHVDRGEAVALMGRAGEAGGDFGKEGLENLEEKNPGKDSGMNPGKWSGREVSG